MSALLLRAVVLLMSALLPLPAIAGTAAAALDVTAKTNGGVPVLLFSEGAHNPPTANPPSLQYQGGVQVGSGTTCTWSFPHAVPAGGAIVGFTHLSDSTDMFPTYTTAISFGTTPMQYNSAPVQWQPFPEDIQEFYLVNVPGGVKSITMTQVITGGGVINPAFCADIGFSVYADAGSVTPIAPVLDSGTPTSSFTAAPIQPALIWGLSSPDANDPTGLGPSGYQYILDDMDTDGIGVWQSPLVQPGTYAPAFASPFYNQNPCDGTNNYELNGGCPIVVTGAVIQGSSISPDGSTLSDTAGGSLLTAAGTWTFRSSCGSEGDNIFLGNSQASNGCAVLLLVYNGGQMYANAGDGTWWEWNGGIWVRQPGDPRG